MNRAFNGIIPNQLYATTFPREMKVTLRYAAFLAQTSTATLALDNVFNLNSIFDPDRTGSGHQPMGHDQWQAFYNRYRVDACKIKITWTDAPTTGSIVGLLGNNDATSITDPGTVVESPLSTWKGMAPNGPAVTITKVFDLAVLNGVTRATYNADDRYSSPFGSSPTEVLVGHVVSYSVAAYTFSYAVQCEYMVTLFDPLQLSYS